MLALVTAPPDDGGTSLEEFLADSGGGTETGEQIERIGHLLSLLGVTLAVGVVVVLIAVVRSARADHRALLRVVQVAGVLVLAGGLVEVAGLAAIGDQSWSDAFDGEFAAASMMRVLAGLMIALGFLESTDGSWRPDSGSAFGLSGLVTGVLSFGFDGHTVTEGIRGVHMTVNAAHVAAAGVWFGGVVALTVVAFLRHRRQETTSIGEMVVRFSPVAAIALITATIAGVLMTLMIVDEPGDVTGTTWGKTLIVKLVAVGFTAAVGGYNHFALVPKLERVADDPSAIHHVRTTLAIEAIEAIVLAYVVVTTAFLVGASTN